MQYLFLLLLAMSWADLFGQMSYDLAVVSQTEIYGGSSLVSQDLQDYENFANDKSTIRIELRWVTISQSFVGTYAVPQNYDVAYQYSESVSTELPRQEISEWSERKEQPLEFNDLWQGKQYIGATHIVERDEFSRQGTPWYRPMNQNYEELSQLPYWLEGFGYFQLGVLHRYTSSFQANHQADYMHIDEFSFFQSGSSQSIYSTTLVLRFFIR